MSIYRYLWLAVPFVYGLLLVCLDVYIALERQIAPRLTDLRRLISQQKADEEDELKEVIEEPPMEFSDDVQNTDAAMDIQK